MRFVTAIPKTGRFSRGGRKARYLQWLVEAVNTSTKHSGAASRGHEWRGLLFSTSSSGCLMCGRSAPKLSRTPNSTPAQLSGGKFTKNSKTKTSWQCSNGHEWLTTYHDVDGGHGCPYCVDMVNGKFVSKRQRELCEMLGGELNYRVGRYCIDVAVKINGAQFCVEYDCWYWHQRTLSRDANRDKYLIAKGWRVLRVKSNNKLPSQEQLCAAIDRLLQGESYTEICRGLG